MIRNDFAMKGASVLTAEQRNTLIEQYASGYDAVMSALDGITPEELDSREGPGEWSPRQVVHHLGDSEMTSAIRIRRMIAEDNPLLQGYDQELFADVLFYDRPIETSLVAFRGARASTVPIFRALSEEQWARTGNHSETGQTSVEDSLVYYADHAHNHADQIRRARAAAQNV
jgi:hypothetical protein